MGPKSNDSYPYKRHTEEKHMGRREDRKGPEKAGAEIGVGDHKPRKALSLQKLEKSGRLLFLSSSEAT